jgi:transcriptional regulator GlxA family with amidase domain
MVCPPSLGEPSQLRTCLQRDVPVIVGDTTIVRRVPGGQGARKEMHNPFVIDWIRRTSETAELVLSVCTGALLLAKTGLLDGLQATTHHGAIDLLRQTVARTTIHSDRRFVDNGRVVCSAGIAAGIDMSLHIVGRLLGEEVAGKTADQMEYRSLKSSSH